MWVTAGLPVAGGEPGNSKTIRKVYEQLIKQERIMLPTTIVQKEGADTLEGLQNINITINI